MARCLIDRDSDFMRGVLEGVISAYPLPLPVTILKYFSVQRRIFVFSLRVHKLELCKSSYVRHYSLVINVIINFEWLCKGWLTRSICFSPSKTKPMKHDKMSFLCIPHPTTWLWKAEHVTTKFWVQLIAIIHKVLSMFIICMVVGTDRYENRLWKKKLKRF